MFFSSLPRSLLPLPVLAAALVLLVVFLGYGARFLTPGGSLSGDGPAAQPTPDLRKARAFVGHHLVAEWPPHHGRNFNEAPSLRGQNEAGALPPVGNRLPKNPLVIVPPQQQGPYGGNWNSFATGAGEIGVMSTLSYETLIRWDPLLQRFHPNLAVDWTIDANARTYTFRLREGIRWSDGEPFTADDILFWYHHILLNRSLTPAIPKVYLRGGEMMNVEKIDDVTIRFTFPEPHGLFMQWVANPFMMEPVSYPAHYFKKFHPDFVDPEELEREAKELGFAFWHQVFLDKAEWHNPERPTLAAWQLTRPPPARRITYARNPYYWKVDLDGNQLPYIDTLTYEIAAPETMVVRFLRGDMGVQNRHVDLRNYPLLMEHRESGNYRVHRWISSRGSGVLMPNLNHRDPGMRDLIGDRRFRIALSHAIDRREISEAIYLGLGEPLQMSPISSSPLYRPEQAKSYTEFDRDKANRLLDELGLDRRDRSGTRLLPDGRPLRMTIDMSDFVADAGAMQLVAEYWTAVGVRSEVKQIARPLYYDRMPARLHDVAVGGDSAMKTPLIDHMFFVPFGLGARHALAFAAWFMSEGERGEEPPEEMKRVMDLYHQIERTADEEEQQELALQILEINAHHLWLIGLVGELPGLTLVHNRFKNVPETAVQFGSAGITAPECYAIDDER